MDSKLRVAVVQDGARLHYAMPRALKRAGMLAGLYTDWYNDGSFQARALLRVAGLLRPELAGRMRERGCAELGGVAIFDHKVSSLIGQGIIRWAGWNNPLPPLIWRYQGWKTLSRTPLAGGSAAVDAVLAIAFMLSPAACRRLQRRGIRVVADQPIAAVREGIRQRDLAAQRWPGWEAAHGERGGAEAVLRWEQAEAALFSAVDHLTCASGYVRDSMVTQGVPAGKVSVIPYPADTAACGPLNRQGRTGAVAVGFVGAVGLRKGAPWLLEVARRCDPKLVKFVMVGPVQVTDFGQEQLRGRVELVGPVPRSEVRDWLGRFDIFLFPSTCEGSAGAVMEAMASGLPIVASPNSGTVLRDGVDGWIIPYDQPEAMAQRVMELAEDEEKRLAMGRAARRRAEEFDIDYYGRELAALLHRVCGR